MITNKPSVTLDGVSFARDEKPIFADLSLGIEQGEFVALLGTNGSGKSTLLDLIAGVLKPDKGTVTRAEERYAFVPQRSHVSEQTPMTVASAVAMGRWGNRGMLGRLTKEDRAEIDSRMEQLNIADLRNAQFSRLSGGQRQRVLIAQALTQRAPLLLLDEPEAGLDSQARAIIQQVLADEVALGTTVVLATHELDSARRTQRCLLIQANAGGIVADGAPDETLSDSTLALAFH
ncbi:zinc ABC transporter ATP-binding protein AztA [Leucobacter chinensis]|uniref:zinc ABC transporter ATP-binding protein AztA n=1 Tax=Leucobacter chinensis TaxID=2851010 RepID=UPI001C244021|nr:zinc ABC transporter ATP-binding protein AztA [Leucobacter chinensis]